MFRARGEQEKEFQGICEPASYGIRFKAVEPLIPRENREWDAMTGEQIGLGDTTIWFERWEALYCDLGSHVCQICMSILMSM